MDELIYLIQKFLTFIPVPFLALVNISITAGWIVLAVLLIRFLFQRAPKWFNCVLWGIVALRLIFPFSVESVFSLIPSAQTIEPNLPYIDEFKINSGIEPIDNAVNTHYSDFVPIAENTVDITIILACVWIIGIATMLVYAFVSWAKLRRNLRTATKKDGNIYQSEFVKSPFVLGFIKPKIYIPYKTDENDLPLVIAHEQAHIKRLDHLIKPLGFLLLSIHWFNPLLWVAYILLCRDIESACDEKVVKELTNEQRKSYSTALLNASISRKSIAACPLAFGETGVKERIKGVMSYKKPAFWIVIAAVIGFVGLTYIRRSGNVNTISSLESAMRSFITEHFAARPRTKEFLIGYPCLVLFTYYIKETKLPLIQAILAAGSAIVAASISNSFCHVFTDASTIYMRVVNGVVIGAAVCVVAYVANLVLVKIVSYVYKRVISK